MCINLMWLAVALPVNLMLCHLQLFSFIQKEFVHQKGNQQVALAAKHVIRESKEQTAKAEAVLREYQREDLENVISLKFCAILFCASCFVL